MEPVLDTDPPDKEGEGSFGRIEGQGKPESAVSARKRKEPPETDATASLKAVEMDPLNELSENDKHDDALYKQNVDGCQNDEEFDGCQNDEEFDPSLEEAFVEAMLGGGHQTPRKEKAMTFSWRMFGLLKAYEKASGHCNVPQKYSENPQLGRWVNAMRKLKKKKEESGEYKSSRIDDDLVHALDKLGFEWKLNLSWEESFELLVKYKLEHGHCDVRTKARQLGRWVTEQRRMYQLPSGKDGKRESLTPERIEKLNGIGFSWKASSN